MGCCNPKVGGTSLAIEALNYGLVEVDIGLLTRDFTVHTRDLRHIVQNQIGVLSCLQTFYLAGARVHCLDLRGPNRRLQMVVEDAAQALVVNVREADLRSKQVSVNKSGTVRRLLVEVAEIWADLELESFKLYYEGAELSPAAQLSTLQDKAVLELRRHTAQVRCLPFTVSVSRIGSAPVQVSVESHTTCAELKHNLEAVVSLPSHMQRLIHKGRELEDDSLLGDAQVCPQSTLHVIAKRPLEAYISSVQLRTTKSAEVRESGDSLLRVCGGVNWLVECSSCQGQTLPGGYGVFDITQIILSCPQCTSSLGCIQGIGFYGCKWRSITQSGVNSEGSSDWSKVSLWDGPLTARIEVRTYK